MYFIIFKKIAHIFLGDTYLGMEKYFLQKVFTFFKLKKKESRIVTIKINTFIERGQLLVF